MQFFSLTSVTTACLQPPVTRLALLTSYDGTPFRGWTDVRDTALRPAIERILGQPVLVEAASRTDAGVHARGQVCAFDVAREQLTSAEISQLAYSLNQLLPSELSVRSAAAVPPGWDPRTNEGKEYRYALRVGAVTRDPLRRLYEWQVPTRRGAPGWDADAAAAAARTLQGTHSFAAFANSLRGSERAKEVDPVCTLSSITLSSASRGGDDGGNGGGGGATDDGGMQYCVRLRGSRFLYKMARNLAGALVRVGQGELSVADLEHALAHGAFERKRSLPLTAPAHGLVLHRVFYAAADEPFTMDGKSEADGQLYSE
tara:strand:+ start:77 stop:1021 length:945 start_codon:yes stop_codon:yes gene_type:complete